MARRLASLLIDIEASTAALSRDMNRAVGIVNSNAKRMTSAMDTVRRSFVGIVSVVAIQRAFKAIISASAESEAAMRQLEARIKSTGGAVGLTAKQISDSAKAFQNASTFDDESILSAQTRLVQFGTIADQVFLDATQAVLDLSAAMGKDLSSSALLVGKALNDPVKGLTALTRVGVSFTDQQKDQIKALVEAGRAADAQRVVLDGLATATAGAARAARDTLGGALTALQNTLNDLLENDSSSLPGLTKAINDLNDSLADPAVKQTIDQFTTALIDGLSWVVQNGPAVVANMESIGKAIVNLGKAFIVFKAASFGAARGGPIGGVLLGTLSAMELFKKDIGLFFASPEMKRLQALQDQSPGDKLAAQRAALGPVANPSGLVVTIGQPKLKTVNPKLPGVGEDAAKAAAKAAKDAADAAAQADKQRVDSINSIIDALAEENFALGRSTEEILINNLAKLNAPPADVERALQLLRETQAYKVNTDAIERQNEAMKRLAEEGRAVADSVRTPSEVLNQELTRLARLRELSAFSADAARNEEIYARAVAAAWKTASDATDKAKSAMGEFALEAARSIQGALGDQLFNVLQGNFDNIGDQFKATLDRMVADALAAQLARKLFGDFDKTGKLGGFVGDVLPKILPSIFGSAKGNIVSGGQIVPFANGGIVQSKTVFPLRNGTGMMGESGPEAIMPLKRLPGGALGVQASGGGGGLVQNFYISGINDARGIREATGNLAARAGAAAQSAMARNG